jgi:hypothetical protein
VNVGLLEGVEEDGEELQHVIPLPPAAPVLFKQNIIRKRAKISLRFFFDQKKQDIYGLKKNFLSKIIYVFLELFLKENQSVGDCLLISMTKN